MVKHTFVRLSLMLFLCLVVAACTSLPVQRPASTNTPQEDLIELRVCDSTNVSSVILTFAQQSNLFEKYGLNVNIVPVAAGPEGTAAVIVGEVDLCHTGAGGPINGALAGEDLLIVAGTINKPFFALVARPEIENVEAINGKTVASGNPRSSSDTFLRLALSSLDIDLSDANIINIGRSADRLAAMATGEVFVGVVTIPEVINARKLGFHVILDAATMDIPYQHTVIMVKHSFLVDNREAVISFIQAMIESIAIMKQDRVLATQILADFLGMDPIEDALLLEEIYDSVVLGYWMQIPYPSIEGIQFLIDEGRQENPNAVELTPNDLIDSSLVQELQESGFIQALYPDNGEQN